MVDNQQNNVLDSAALKIVAANIRGIISGLRRFSYTMNRGPEIEAAFRHLSKAAKHFEEAAKKRV